MFVYLCDASDTGRSYISDRVVFAILAIVITTGMSVVYIFIIPKVSLTVKTLFIVCYYTSSFFAW